MKERPTLTTQRLLLRPMALEDAPTVQRLAGAHEIARTTLAIPHPYEDGMAEQWISMHQQAFEEGRLINFGMVIREGDTLCGNIGLVINQHHHNAELGYWVGVPYWGQGYCTEAARAVVDYGFRVAKLHRIHAVHLKSNPASGRVMQKIGMTYEGCSRHHIYKWGEFGDVDRYGILADEWQASAP